MIGCDAKFCYNCKGENSSNESNDGPYSPPSGIGVSSDVIATRRWFPTLGKFRVVKVFIDPELIREVESRMLEYSRLKPSMEVRTAGDNVFVVPHRVFYWS